MQIDKILEVQRRFYRKEKNRFLDAVEEKLTEYGYEFERKKFGRIIKGTPKNSFLQFRFFKKLESHFNFLKSH